MKFSDPFPHPGSAPEFLWLDKLILKLVLKPRSFLVCIFHFSATPSLQSVVALQLQLSTVSLVLSYWMPWLWHRLSNLLHDWPLSPFVLCFSSTMSFVSWMWSQCWQKMSWCLCTTHVNTMSQIGQLVVLNSSVEKSVAFSLVFTELGINSNGCLGLCKNSIKN